MSQAELPVSIPFQTKSERLQADLYSQAVMKEAMRLHPSVGMPLERFVPDSGLNVAGIQLPAGTIVSMIAPVLHHDEKVFGTDADKFRPERWIDANPEQLRMMNRSFLTVSRALSLLL